MLKGLDYLTIFLFNYKYIAVISDISEFELKFAPNHVRQILTDIPSKNLEIANLTDEARKLPGYYINEKNVKKSLADTQHIAIATIQQVDLLVSWNFKHIVNYYKIRLYNAENLNYGYKILEIRNPSDLTDEK